MPTLKETVAASDEIAVVQSKAIPFAAQALDDALEAYICLACAALYRDKDRKELFLGVPGDCCSTIPMQKVDAHSIVRKPGTGEIIRARFLD